ncbi:RAB6-interacting golgin-like [Ptychodera flava]|uniref:RAB6-interacting golgin-like n=1 Tax=Ptychodera flava TaxID=63121 RepID=UPI00396A0FDC
MAWAGFTDDQLRQIKGSEEREDMTYDNYHSQQGRPRHQSRAQSAKHRQQSQQQQQRQPQRGKMMAGQRQRQQKQIHEDIDDSQRLSVPKKVQGRPQQRASGGGAPPESRKPDGRSVLPDELSSLDDSQSKSSAAGDHDDSIRNDAHQKEEKEKDAVHEIDETAGISREMTNIEKRRMLQQKMEEENKRMKALLAKAVADRRKRADAETRKLKDIQKELTKIDGLISNDVAILRDKIEEASREYLAAQRRYEKAEAEFIASKMDLHEKTEAKDSLTEHLYSIIQENELRKAKKLEELMAKLEVENLEEYLQEEKHDAAIQSNNVETETKTVATTLTATDSTQVETESTAANAITEPVGQDNGQQQGGSEKCNAETKATENATTTPEVESSTTDTKGSVATPSSSESSPKIQDKNECVTATS